MADDAGNNMYDIAGLVLASVIGVVFLAASIYCVYIRYSNWRARDYDACGHGMDTARISFLCFHYRA